MALPSALATDLYQLTMMAGYEAMTPGTTCTFELFVRELPSERAFLVAAGLQQALDYLEGVHFTADEIAWLRTVPGLSQAPADFFDRVLPDFRFAGEVWAVDEGEIVFGHEPLVRVTARASEAQLVETALVAIITFQTSVASKAARVVKAAAGRPVIEFGSRRAHGLEAARLAARAACLAGCDATSNVEAARLFGLPVVGTMAHSWVMAFDDEMEAFRAYSRLFGSEAVLLIDTYDTINAANRIVQAGLTPAAVRIDSGDLTLVSRSVRAILDAGGLRATRILVSGDLDEHRISQLVGSLAPVDSFGVGTSISTVRDAPALGGIYKLVETERQGRVTPTLKLSTGKRTFPGRKQVWRVTDRGRALYDVIGLGTEMEQEGRPLLKCVMRDGRRLEPSPRFVDVQRNAIERLAELPPSVTPLEGAIALPVTISPALDALARSAHRAEPSHT
jgi:nicotinate phosphoribosyltransferase